MSEETEGAEGKRGKGKLIAIIVVVVVVLLGGAGGGAWYMGYLDSFLKGKIGTKTATIELGAPVNHELPQIKADLKTGQCRSPFIRLSIIVELGGEDLPRLKAVELRVLDAIRAYLREQERQDMVGKAGTEKLRFDITRIINNLIAPARIHAIIFKDFILQ